MRVLGPFSVNLNALYTQYLFPKRRSPKSTEPPIASLIPHTALIFKLANRLLLSSSRHLNCSARCRNGRAHGFEIVLGCFVCLRGYNI